MTRDIDFAISKISTKTYRDKIVYYRIISQKENQTENIIKCIKEIIIFLYLLLIFFHTHVSDNRGQRRKNKVIVPVIAVIITV